MEEKLLFSFREAEARPEGMAICILYSERGASSRGFVGGLSLCPDVREAIWDT